MKLEMKKDIKMAIRPGMSPNLTVALIQFESKMADKDANLHKVLDYIKKAAEEKADLVVFHEMCIQGYNCGAELEKTSILFELADPIPGPTADTITKAAKENNIYVIVGIVEANTEKLGHIHNSALFTGPEGIVGVFRKIHLPTLPSSRTVREIHWGLAPGNEIPVWKIKQGWNIGISICYDQAFPEVARVQTIKGADVIVSVSAAHEWLKEHWFSMNQQRAIENRLFVVYSNTVGKQGGDATFFGGVHAIGPGGEFIAKGPIDEEHMLVVKLEAKDIVYERFNHPYLRDRRPLIYKEIIQFP